MAVVLMLVAVFCCGLFAGACIYVNLAEHPARLRLGVAPALAGFGLSFRRAALMQSVLAAVDVVAAGYVWLAGGGRIWLVGGLLLLAVVPFTLLGMMPTNRGLLDPATAGDEATGRTLLGRWGRLHTVRSVLGVAAFVLFLLALARGGPLAGAL